MIDLNDKAKVTLKSKYVFWNATSLVMLVQCPTLHSIAVEFYIYALRSMLVPSDDPSAPGK